MSLDSMVNVKHLVQVFMTFVMVNIFLVPDIFVAMPVMVLIFIIIFMVLRFNIKAMVHWLVELMVLVKIVVTIMVRYFIIIVVDRLRLMVVLVPVIMLIVVMTWVDCLIHVMNGSFDRVLMVMRHWLYQKCFMMRFWVDVDIFFVMNGFY